MSALAPSFITVGDCTWTTLTRPKIPDNVEVMDDVDDEVL